MRVFQGRLVHCKVSERVEILEDHLIGFEENKNGKVSAYITDCKTIIIAHMLIKT